MTDRLYHGCFEVLRSRPETHAFGFPTIDRASMQSEFRQQNPNDVFLHFDLQDPIHLSVSVDRGMTTFVRLIDVDECEVVAVGNTQLLSYCDVS